MVSIAKPLPFFGRRHKEKAAPVPKRNPQKVNIEMVGPIVMRFQMHADEVLAQPWRFPPECRKVTPGLGGQTVWWQGYKVRVQKQNDAGEPLWLVDGKEQVLSTPEHDEQDKRVPAQTWGLAPLPLHRLPRLNLPAAEHIAAAQAERDPMKRMVKAKATMPMPTFTATLAFHTGDEPLLRKFVAMKGELWKAMKAAIPLLIIGGELLLVYILFGNITGG